MENTTSTRTPPEPAAGGPSPRGLSRRGLLGGALALGAAWWPAPAWASGLDTERVYRNRATGETFRFLSADDRAVRYLWTVSPGGGVPFEHEHPLQDEVFEILSGSLRFWLGDREVVARAGRTVRVPRGALHDGICGGDEPLRAVVSLEPGLDAVPALQVLWGLCDDGYIDASGRPDLVTAAALTSHFACCPRPALVPEGAYPLSGLALRALQSRSDYRALYRRYTGQSL